MGGELATVEEVVGGYFPFEVVWGRVASMLFLLWHEFGFILILVLTLPSLFTHPAPTVQAAIGSNTYSISGAGETKGTFFLVSLYCLFIFAIVHYYYAFPTALFLFSFSV